MKKIEEKVVEAPNLSVLKPEYANKWVALSADYKKLLAVGETLQDVLNMAHNFTNKVVIKVLPNLGYAPIIHS